MRVSRRACHRFRRQPEEDRTELDRDHEAMLAHLDGTYQIPNEVERDR
jgi:hypothetical protein